MSQINSAFHILVADDDGDDRLMVRDSFLENNTKDELTFVEDGRELMDYLLRKGKYVTIDQKLPALILLDLNMPKMDGREALKEIKSTPSLCHIPVLVFTTSKADEDIYNAYKLGANSFIIKPVTFQALVETIARIRDFWFGTALIPQ